MESDKKSGQVATTIIGLILTVCAVCIFYVVPRGNIAGLIAGAVVLMLGVEALIAAYRGRPSLLSKIGPLP